MKIKLLSNLVEMGMWIGACEVVGCAIVSWEALALYGFFLGATTAAYVRGRWEERNS